MDGCSGGKNGWISSGVSKGTGAMINEGQL